METFNNTTYIIAGSVIIVVIFSTLFYKYVTNITVLEPTIIEPIIVEPPIIEPTKLFVDKIVDLYIPEAPLDQPQFYKLYMIFKDDSIACGLLNAFYTGRDKLHFHIMNDPKVPEDLKLDLYADILPHAKEWHSFVAYLKTIEPPPALRQAIENNILELDEVMINTIQVESFVSGLRSGSELPSTFEMHEMPESIEGIFEEDIIEEPIIEIIDKSTNKSSFLEFICSEIGLKCLVVGLVCGVGILGLIHIVIKYYYKTTYKAIYYKIKTFFFQ